MNRSFRLMSRGFSLVELLVALAVSMVLIVAALMLFSETRNSQRAVDQISNANEAGAYVLRLVGRDLANAGFYPAEFNNNDVAAPVGSYFNPFGKVKNAYDYGIYGCQGAQFDVQAGACGAASNAGKTGSDSVVIGYFTTDAFDRVKSHRYDCEGFDVTGAAVNARAYGSATVSSTTSPSKPLFVANHYYLPPASNVINTYADGGVQTKSFSCKGLVSRPSDEYQPLISGIEEFQLLYGVYVNNNDSGSYDLKFLTADGVNSEPSITVNDETIRSWQRVLAVRVCVVAKTFETASASISGGSSTKWTKCDGSKQNNVTGDRAIRKTYTQIFSLKNNLKTVY